MTWVIAGKKTVLQKWNRTLRAVTIASNATRLLPWICRFVAAWKL